MPVLGAGASCPNHPERLTKSRFCTAAVRDRKNLERSVCVCCDECRAECATHAPHNHGGSIEDEWDRNAPTSTGIRCKLCGIEIF